MLLVTECKDNPLCGLCSRMIYWDAMNSFWTREKIQQSAFASPYISLLLTLLLQTPTLFFYTFLLTLPHPHFLKLFLSLFAVHISPVLESPLYSQCITSLSLSLFPTSEYPLLSSFPSLRNPRVNVDCVDSYWVLFEEALAFLFSCSLYLAGWAATNLTLVLVCGFCDRHDLVPAACGQWNVAVELMPLFLLLAPVKNCQCAGVVGHT